MDRRFLTGTVLPSAGVKFRQAPRGFDEAGVHTNIQRHHPYTFTILGFCTLRRFVFYLSIERDSILTMSEDERLQEYYSEFQSLLAQRHATSDDDSATATWLQQAQSLLQQLSVEARSLSGDDRMEWMERVKLGKSQLQAVKVEMDRAKLGVHNNGRVTNGDAARQLQSNEDSLMRQNATLEQARRTIQETEEVGAEISSELHKNRNTIESSHRNVRELGSLTGRANELLKSLSKKKWF